MPAEHPDEQPGRAENEVDLDESARQQLRAQASPRGIVSILFTDVVGSTRMRQRLGDEAAQERFHDHNEVLLEQIRKHGGVVVKSQGDGFMVAVTDVAAALACAVDMQQAVGVDNSRHADVPVEIRIGLNIGQAIEEDSDFFGGSVVVAARLVDMARPGQILVSETVRGIASLRPDIHYRHVGRRRLKGFEDSVDIWAVEWSAGERPLSDSWRGRLRLALVAGASLVAAVILAIVLLNLPSDDHGSTSGSLLKGAGAMFRGDPRHSGTLLASGPDSADVQVSWSLDTNTTRISSTPALDGEVLFVAGGDALYALDVETGRELWRFVTAGLTFSSPAVAGGRVYVGALEGSVYAIDARSGEPIWRVITGDEVRSSPNVVGGTVYVGSFDKRLYAIDADTGKLSGHLKPQTVSSPRQRWLMVRFSLEAGMGMSTPCKVPPEQRYGASLPRVL